jgi:HEAT repeats/PBS lyase HEAT-like repeat
MLMPPVTTRPQLRAVTDSRESCARASDTPRMLKKDSDQPPLDLALPSGFFAEPASVRRRHADRLMGRTPSGVHGRELLATWHESGDPGLLHTFNLLLERDPDEEVKRSAVQGLARIPDPAVASGLLKGLALPDRKARYVATEALGRLRSREALPMLASLLADRYCRSAAAKALVSIRDERALDPLRMAGADASLWRRRRLRRMIAVLEAEVGYQAGEG